MIIELDNICKHYKNVEEATAKNVLENISLAVRASESIAITGPSGSGKSTLLNIMGTLDSQTSGIVKINGIDISNLDQKQLAAIRSLKIGFIFQLHHLLPQLSVIENILVPAMLLNDKHQREEAGNRALELLETIGLADKAHRRPGQLSVGECQRAAVVRALINNPDIILADEPTGSLDQETSEQTGELLAAINKKHGVALVVVTHSVELAKKMGATYNLLNGKLVKVS